uniref:Ribonuclease A-domain domain-containing protein n=1 Tax=Oreochromis niloticus TaxID=8128 RepID=A0A669C835_ORENI
MFTCLLLVLPFATGLSKPANLQPNPIEKRLNETNYEKFRRQHVDAKMSVKKCDTEIKKKKIYVDGNKCKKANTFILSDYKQVKAICNGQGRYDQTNKTKSKAKFRIVRCDLMNNGARKPNCRYNGTLLTNRTVVVKCEKKCEGKCEKLPVIWLPSVT